MKRNTVIENPVTGENELHAKTILEQVSRVSPAVLEGEVEAGEVSNLITTAPIVNFNFPAGLKGVVLDYHSSIAGSTPLATSAYISFNNSPMNDVASPGLRMVIPLGKLKSKMFNFAPYPTLMTITFDSPDTASGDTTITWEAVT